jgi:hypothetical protein
VRGEEGKRVHVSLLLSRWGGPISSSAIFQTVSQDLLLLLLDPFLPSFFFSSSSKLSLLLSTIRQGKTNKEEVENA